MPRTDKELLEIASKYETRGAWNKGDSASNSAARKRGKEFFELCCAHMKKVRESWNRDKIQAIADKYETRSAWQAGDLASYKAARGGRYGDLDSFCNHMNFAYKSWNRDKIQAIGDKYETRSAWEAGDNASYKAAHKGLYGDLDSFCTHMHKLHSFSSYRHMMITEESQNKARLSSSCVTYFIKIKLPCNMIVYKIGYTHDFDSRCSGFAKENVEVVEVIDIVNHDNQFDAMTYEHECQNHNDALGFNAGLLSEQKFAGYTECYSQLEHKGITYKN